jgi:hypothetical protein
VSAGPEDAFEEAAATRREIHLVEAVPHRERVGLLPGVREERVEGARERRGGAGVEVGQLAREQSESLEGGEWDVGRGSVGCADRLLDEGEDLAHAGLLPALSVPPQHPLGHAAVRLDELEPVAVRLREDVGLRGVDPGPAEFEELAVDPGREGSAAEPVARLEEQGPQARVLQLARRRDAREAAADHDDVVRVRIPGPRRGRAPEGKRSGSDRSTDGLQEAAPTRGGMIVVAHGIPSPGRSRCVRSSSLRDLRARLGIEM